MRNEARESQISMREQEIKPYRRGLLDILDVHACAGSEIGCNRRKIRTSGSKDGIPYEPSLKSLPCSSSSEESIQLKNKSSNSQNKTKSIDNDRKIHEDISDDSENSIYFETRRQKGITKDKVKRNSELRIVPDIIPEQSNESLLNNNYSFNYFKRKTSRHMGQKTNIHSIIDIDNPSTEENKEIELSSLHVLENDMIFGMERDCLSSGSKSFSECLLNQATNQISFSSIEKNLGCDSKGNVPSASSFNESGELKGSNQKLGDVLFKTRKNQYKIKDDLKQMNILRLFDCHKYPLTDTTGNILHTANNQALVIFKNGKPQFDCYNRLVFDEYGESSLSPMFKPYGIVLKKGRIVSEIPLFDFQGHPLVDHDGSSLLNSNGDPLIITNMDGNLLHDINMHPIFDKSGIPVTKLNDCWVTPSGKPYKVFDKFKNPLTDSNGRPLYNVNKVQLLLCDRHGRPIFDYNNEPVFDVNGFRPTDAFFSPLIPPEFLRKIVITVIENKPVQIFNNQGFPLTEDDGKILKDARGKYLLEASQAEPISSNFSDCEYYILYCCLSENSMERILPDSRLSEIDNNLGQDGTKYHSQLAIQDKKGRKVYDIEGRQIFLKTSDNTFVNSSEWNSNESGRSYKSKPSISLDKSNSNHYTSDHASDFTIKKLSNLSNTDESLGINFKIETDLFGRPLFDSLNRPLFDKYGRPIYDLFLRPLYDSDGRPISDADGKLLRDGRNESEEYRVSYDLGYKNELAVHLMHRNTDLNGGPLFDRFCEPLYNKKGKPLKDAFGRPLYDDDGKPLCNEDGLPISKQIKQKGVKLLHVEDKFQKLIVYPENTPRGASNEGSSGSEEINDVKYYNGRVRVTTFIDGEQVIELLEVAPASNVQK